jgi:anti-sigma B factor antagonist
MLVHERLEIGESHGVTVVRVRDGDLLDETAIEDLGQELFQLIESEDRRHLVLDFSLVEFLTSAVLGKLITLHKKVAARGGRMKLCRICPNIREVLAITKLDGVFEIEDNVADAVAALGRDISTERGPVATRHGK